MFWGLEQREQFVLFLSQGEESRRLPKRGQAWQRWAVSTRLHPTTLYLHTRAQSCTCFCIKADTHHIKGQLQTKELILTLLYNCKLLHTNVTEISCDCLLLTVVQLPDLKDAEAVQKFFLEEIQLGEELLAQGNLLFIETRTTELVKLFTAVQPVVTLLRR